MSPPLSRSHSPRVSVVDYGAGNLGSVLRALAALGVEPDVVRDPQAVARCGHVVFPGVGAAGQAMASLQTSGLGEALKGHVRAGKPLLGICVGMQVLGEHSAESDTPCLGVLPFHLERFDVSEPVPHMGWNSLEPVSANPAARACFEGLGVAPDTYFVHSYYAPLDARSEAIALATTTYAGVRFVSAVARENVWGMQFHSEKSGRTGLALVRNFLSAF